jgi:UDP-N-acetyl-D-glucosamine dehydrogenase
MKFQKYKKLDKKKIAIIGLGYVGLPLIIKFLNSKKYDVIGIDNDVSKINLLKKGKSYISHISNNEAKLVAENSFNLTNNYKSIKKADSVIFTLPTPITKNKDPDMTYISSALQSAKNYFTKNQLVVLESTVYPGATADYFLPIFKEKNLIAGKNIFLGYSPEREDPGNINFNISNIIKLVSGYSKKCLLRCEELYSSINIKTKKVSSIKTAEVTKLYENIFRSVNIGLVNEMKLISDKMNLDIHEIIDAAKTKPFGFKAFYPGPGLGGHCIPIDPYLLTWKAKQYDLHTKFVELSADINNSMPNFVIEKISDSLNIIKKNFSNSKIFIIGVAYKKNVNDVRESPSLKIIESLHAKGVKIFYHDDYIKKVNIKISKKDFSLRKKDYLLKSIKLNKKNLETSDLVCIVTDHDYINYELIKKYSRIIVDCRGRFKSKKNIIKA